VRHCDAPTALLGICGMAAICTNLLMYLCTKCNSKESQARLPYLLLGTCIPRPLPTFFPSCPRLPPFLAAPFRGERDSNPLYLLRDRPTLTQVSQLRTANYASIPPPMHIFFFFFWSLYAFPPRGALGYEADAHAYATHVSSIHAGISLHMQILDRKGKGLLFCTSVPKK